MPGYYGQGSNCKKQILGSYDEYTIKRLVKAADNEFHDRKPPPKSSQSKRPSQRCSRYSDVELMPDERLKLPVSKPVKIPSPKIKKPTTYNGPPNYALLPELQPCHYGGKPKKIKTKKAKKNKVRKTNKSRKSTNFLFNLFK
jgi:hypothetical protein